MKTVVCLGAGYVARPYIKYLSDCDFYVIVASRTREKAEQLVNDVKNTEVVRFDIQQDNQLLEELTKKADLVCSLLPYTYHVKAAKVAIHYKTHFCTTSYISEEMQLLDSKAKEAGIILLNECGVDPGIDHMSAMRIINRIHNDHGKVLSFTSFTGGLPAPEANTNPFGYKLSWSPRGVLLAGRNDAQFLQNGVEIKIAGKNLFDNCKVVEIPGVGIFEAYPNRNSLSYVNIYGIPETKTMLRGTLRNLGWCSTLKKIADLGLLDLTKQDLKNMTYRDLMLELCSLNNTIKDPRIAVAEFLGISPNNAIIKRFEWLGLFSNTPIPNDVNTFLDALCHLFEQKLQYAPGERDMIVMHHEFVADYNGKQDIITSTLLEFGIPFGDSAMARTVALPAAVATRMILEDKIKLTGVYRPTIPAIYEPILNELEKMGIKFKEEGKLFKIAN